MKSTNPLGLAGTGDWTAGRQFILLPITIKFRAIGGEVLSFAFGEDTIFPCSRDLTAVLEDVNSLTMRNTILPASREAIATGIGERTDAMTLAVLPLPLVALSVLFAEDAKTMVVAVCSDITFVDRAI